ncbi:MAG: sugar ABC transporter permease [Treponema sp.]|jgi:raffinose/stachyose/melibiose transport system permease protein|nr:sugar ABC transporter permease [Treponema sp.]
MSSESRSLRKVRERQIRIAAAVFLSPAIIIMIVFIAYPIIDSFIISTTEWNGVNPNRKFVGMENWITLAKDPDFWTSFRNNLTIMFVSLLTQGILAMALATFLDIMGRKGIVFKVVWFLPYLISSVAIGILFKFVLDANFGMFAAISRAFGGGSVDLLGRAGYALFAVIGVVSWQYTPFYMILYLAAYGTIPVELYEAASIDGATRNQYFWRVSLPLLRPTIISGATVCIIGSLKYFDLIYVMTGGGPGVSTDLMATMMYRTSFVKNVMGYGAAIAGGMFILITLIALVVVTTLNKKAAED